ncbi:uracil-DNA glycosylase [candidate division KSB1 bacterium]|nr:uracil-DNA glycosylase [candidate division KSB1 bacterium]
MISEVPPPDLGDYFYSESKFPDFLKTTLQAFHDAGFEFSSMKDIIDAGIYLTTAVKCGKIGYTVSANVIQTCSYILEKEIALLPDVGAYLLMGDVAIRAFNTISHRLTGQRAIPAGSTYKIRSQEFYYSGKRVFPSYLQTGKNYLIEKSKRKMIAEDIEAAFRILE